MAKDPSFLFYSNDFLTGTYLMSDEQVGKYIRLLCLQHQKGFLCEKDMIKICKSYDEDIFSKFIKEDEIYYNKRLSEETEKRKLYSESRKNNRKSKDMINISKTYVQHMENENENNITSINTLNTNSNSIKKEYNTVTDSKDSNWETDKNNFTSDEQMQMNYKTVYGLTREEVVEYINKFITQIELAQDYKDLKELRKHFKNWMNKKNPVSKFQKEVPQYNPKGYVVQTPMHLWGKNFEGEE
jgi:hypothetical protein